MNTIRKKQLAGRLFLGFRPRWFPSVSVCALIVWMGPLAVRDAFAQASAASTLAWEKKTGLGVVNAPLLADLVNTASPEIVLTDNTGHIQVYDAESGKLLKSKRISEGALTAPVAGDFLGDGRLHLAMGAKGGWVYFLDGASLNVLDQRKMAPADITAPPVVVELPKGANRSMARAGMVLADQRGNVRCCYLNDAQAIQQAWEAAVNAQAFPLAAGYVRDKNQLDVVVAAASNLVLINAETGKPREKHASDRNLAAACALVEISGDFLPDVICADDTSVFVFEYKKGLKDIQLYWKDNAKFSVAPRPSFDPVFALEQGKTPPVIFLQAGGPNVFAINPLADSSGGGKPLQLWQNGEGGRVEVSTSLAAFRLQGGSSMAAFARGGDFFLLDAFGGKNRLDPAQEKAAPVYSFKSDALEGTIVAGCVDPKGTSISFWGVLRNSKNLIRLDVTAPGFSAAPYSILWATRGGNLWRSGGEDLDFKAWDDARRTRLEASKKKNLEQYETAKSAKEALAAARWLESYNPYDSAYRGYRRMAWIRKNLLTLILATLLFFLVIGYSSWKIAMMATRGMRINKAESALAAGDLEAAAEWYRKVLKADPNNPKLNAALARVYIAKGDFGSATLPAFRIASDTNPDAADFINAYARALAFEPVVTDEAMTIYRKAIQAFPEPALLEYALGCCHKERKEWNEAGKHLRAALRGGLQNGDVFAALCDVYLAMDFRQAKAVPVFQQQYPKRQGDQVFLEAYLDACDDAKMVDSATETLCQQVLENNPQYVRAFCLQGKIRLHERDQAGAAQAVDRALAIAPDHPESLYLRSQIDLIEGRMDEKSVENFIHTLKHFPNDRDLLRVTANFFAQRQRYDEQAIDIYKRSAHENPNDVATLRALAIVGRLLHDPGQTVDAIERLAALGQMNIELTQQLAQAYVAMKCSEPKAERVLREALRAEPANDEYAALLGQALLRLDRQDADSIPIYERAAKNDAANVEMGRQLVRAYNRANRYGEALALAQRLLAISPDDGELKRLVALSSLYDNKIDQAINEYQSILTRNPEDREAVVNIALAFAQKGKTDDAAARYYQQALAVTPENENLHLIMARVFAARGDQAKCVESYQHALKTRPNVEEKALRHCEALLNEYPQAVRVRWFYCEVLVAYNRLREALDQLALILEGSPEQARNVLAAIDKILGKDPKNIQALLQRGELLRGMNMLPDARATLERCFTLQPASPEAQKALIECYEALLAVQDDAEIRFRLGKLCFLSQDYDKAIGCFQRTAHDYRWEAESAKMLGKCFVGKGMLDLALQEFKKLVIDDEAKELLYDLAQRYEQKRDLVGAKQVYRQLFAADINYRDVKQRFEMLSGSTSDPAAFEKTSIVQQMSEEAKRRYELLDELGRGAMGIVYRARDKELEEVVALKILPDNLSNNPEAVRRFKVEARNARRLSHPNIVRIHDIGEEMGRKYISMEIVEGTDLKKKVRSKGKMTLSEVVHYGIQTADALDYAHKLGIVHRDIKPANIMLTKKNEVKITDFGIAKLVDATGEGTMLGAVIGTPLYMSPEQVQGLPVDNRADIYSFGIMLYEFINGKPPFTEGDLAYQHMHKPPEPLANCPPELWRIIARCLEKDRESRWPTAGEIVEHLKTLAKTLPPV